jgi:1-acyl-sn-glycerol-3-phosphate acyltransferase
MLKWLSELLFKISGWKMGARLSKDIRKCVMIAAPHTSNWDLVFARAAFFIMGVPVRFTIKKEWMVFPLNLLIRPLGGIAIDRGAPQEPNRKSTVDAMAQLFEQRESLVILVTPEGSRSLRTQWKSGFYFVALKAQVPIALGYLDYVKKEAGVGKIVMPTGNFEEDITVINDFYRGITGKFPEKFSPHQLNLSEK